MVGGCRGAEDQARLRDLQQYAEELGIGDYVEWYVNVPFSELKMLLGGAVGGLHTMTDEHFGISVVEYMAAGEGDVHASVSMSASHDYLQHSVRQPVTLPYLQQVCHVCYASKAAYASMLGRCC